MTVYMHYLYTILKICIGVAIGKFVKLLRPGTFAKTNRPRVKFIIPCGMLEQKIHPKLVAQLASSVGL